MVRKSFILIVLFALCACGGKEVKQQSQESKTSLEAFSVAETIKNAFTKNDLSAVQNNCTAEGYKDVTINRRPFDTVELTFTPRWVEIDGSQVQLNVAWKNEWKASGKTTSDRGMAVFVMDGRPLKLTKILRANPFVFPEK